jgi:hypothetical protein
MFSGSIIRHTGDKESDASAKAELQTVINQMLEQEPWKVGFSEVGQFTIYLVY